MECTIDKVKKLVCDKRECYTIKIATEFIQVQPPNAKIESIDWKDENYMKENNREKWAYGWTIIRQTEFNYVYLIAWKPHTPKKIKK